MLSPLGSRYSDKTSILRNYFTEYEFTKQRVYIEIKYLIELSNIIGFSINKEELLSIYTDFSETDFKQIKKIETKTKHDVKSIEYFLRDKVKGNASFYIHIGCTSEDINNIAYGLILKRFINTEYITKIKQIIDILGKYPDTPIISRTHGIPATPTTIKKEFLIYKEKLKTEISKLKKIEFIGKLNGASGNFIAHRVLLGSYDWRKFSDDFISGLGLKPNNITNQLGSYDYMIDVFDRCRHINNILLNLCKDIWLYCNNNIFTIKNKANQIGSSTMPHKKNPILFENSEGNLELSNSLFILFSNKFSQTRLQRDLSDSTVKRNIGIGFGYSFVAYCNIIEGLKSVNINKKYIAKEFDNNWQILLEPIQIIMKKNLIPGSFEKVIDHFLDKEYTRHNIISFIQTLKIQKADKEYLLNLTPDKYI